MRTHKFIVFDKHEKTMRPVVDLWMDPNGTISHVFTGVEDKNGSSTLFGNFDVLEYIGKKDLNGVEMFEGHIVKYPMPTPLYGENKKYVDQLSVVIWDHDLCGYRTTNSSNITSSHEVVGHIFLNPELVEKMNEKT